MRGSRPRLTARQIPGLTHITSIAAGGRHALALTADGHVETWGDDTDGQLGPSRSSTSATPATVTGLSGVTEIVAGDAFSVALLDDGSVRAWGADTHHQLGAGSPVTAGDVVTAYDTHPVASLTAHADSVLAVLADGDVEGWGADSSGQLADANTSDQTPETITALTGSTSLTLGDGAGFAINATGTPSSWGAGSHGQLGLGTTSNHTTPATISGYDASTDAGTAWTYAYDGDGLRVSKTDGTTATSFSWDQVTGSLPLDLTIGTSSVIYGPDDLPLEQVSNSGTPTYYHHDQLGSTRLITDATGTVEGTYTYSSYGKPSASTGTITPAFGYAGQYTDPETGFTYNQARYYDPATGQFISVDPLAAQTGSAYGYADSDPSDETDPDGDAAIPGDGIEAPGLPVGQARSLTGAGLLAALAAFAERCREADCLNRPGFHRHHIVAKGARVRPAVESRAILRDVEIGINDEENIVKLPAGFHQRLHTLAYYRSVCEQLVAAYFGSGGTAYERVVSALDRIRMQIMMSSDSV